ncbi:MAG: DUF4988 domain-containing protein [Prevotellaceae bacterium]|jgi:hypothetical protein|nr:DUF4988 domain-containing protein [Prevotellaceae bacterium]
MKKVFSILMALLAFCSCDKYNHEALENELNDLKSRVAALEEWAETVNSNISALQNLVATLQNGDYVTGVSPFSSPAPGGYIISFVSSGNIVISNGTDGKNGAGGKDGANGKDGVNGRDGANGKNGADGQDGLSPQPGVKQDSDGAY